MSRKSPKAIPEFNSIEEEAEFWDTHDLTEFGFEFKKSEGPLEAPAASLTIDVDSDTMAALGRIADRGEANLFSMLERWIRERVAVELATQKTK
jgi:hypothetical protein